MPDFVGPTLLAPDHVLEGFDCGDAALDSWLIHKARHNQRGGSSRTWVVTSDQRVAAFYSSSTAVIVQSDATKRAARNQPDPLPALLLGRLAVDTRFQGCGLGAALLKHFLLKSIEVAELTGVRALLVHAKDDGSASFYRRYGFEPSPVDDLTLMLLVQDVARGM
ncbi:MAG: GNAT family N-acetyltransferase [Acidimicrobiia bacterium]